MFYWIWSGYRIPKAQSIREAAKHHTRVMYVRLMLRVVYAAVCACVMPSRWHIGVPIRSLSSDRAVGPTKDSRLLNFCSLHTEMYTTVFPIEKQRARRRGRNCLASSSFCSARHVSPEAIYPEAWYDCDEDMCLHHISSFTDVFWEPLGQGGVESFLEWGNLLLRNLITFIIT